MLITDHVRAMIDTSCEEKQARAIAAQGLDLIINTHFHEDHIMFNWIFDKSQIWAHSLDAPAIRSLDLWKELFGFSYYGDDEIGDTYRKNIKTQSSPVHKELRDGELIDLGTVKLRVLHTPGHTRGHCSYFEENEGILYAGEITLSNFGPWYGHLDSDIDQYIKSIERCKELRPRLVISSHLGIINDDIDKRMQAFLDRIHEKENIILNELNIPQTLEQLTEKKLYYGTSRQLPHFRMFFEKVAVHKHLQRLTAAKRIASENGVYFKI
jgi:glyoxylase-like metal-dependent hydrolase (beta-lactamase superfamily II)